nr:Protein kinase,IPR002048 Calcium-binding EF-hand,domain-containing protein [Schistosoma japonicum]
MFDNEEMAKSIPTDELKVDKNRLKPPVDHSS